MRRAITIDLLCLICSLAAVPGVASAGTGPVRLEAESFVAYGNWGSYFPSIVADAHASGGIAVDGFRLDGMWLEYDVTLNDSRFFQFGVQSAGDLGLVREYRVSIRPKWDDGAVAEDSLVTFPGQGAG